MADLLTRDNIARIAICLALLTAVVGRFGAIPPAYMADWYGMGAVFALIGLVSIQWGLRITAAVLAAMLVSNAYQAQQRFADGQREEMRRQIESEPDEEADIQLAPPDAVEPTR